MSLRIVDPDDPLHVRLGLVSQEGAVAVVIRLEEGVVELAAASPR